MKATVASGDGGASRVMKIRQAGVQIEKALSSFSGAESVLLSFLSSSRTMRLLDEVVAASSGDDLDVPHPVEHGKFPDGRTVAP